MNLYRSLKFNRPPDENLLKILERLAEKGYLQNNRQLREFGSDSFHISSYSQVISSMKTLETLELESYMSFRDLALVFQSCSKLTELNFTAFEFEMYGMGEDLKIELRPGFQRLRRLHLRWYIDSDSLPVTQGCNYLQEMLT
jgi:hypothetical protein